MLHFSLDKTILNTIKISPVPAGPPTQTPDMEGLTAPRMISANSVSKALAWAKPNEAREADARVFYAQRL